MDTYIFKITSAKGVNLEYLYVELGLIVEKYKGEGTTSIKRVTVSNCILLTSDNLKLRAALLKDDDFILE